MESVTSQRTVWRIALALLLAVGSLTATGIGVGTPPERAHGLCDTAALLVASGDHSSPVAIPPGVRQGISRACWPWAARWAERGRSSTHLSFLRASRLPLRAAAFGRRRLLRSHRSSLHDQRARRRTSGPSGPDPA